MNRTDVVFLKFNEDLNKLGKKKQLRQRLSVVVQVGDTLWVHARGAPCRCRRHWWRCCVHTGRSS